jgi:tight adherence protein C
MHNVCGLLIASAAAVSGEGKTGLLAGAASLAVGLAVLVVAWWVARALQTDDPKQGAQWRYDVSRMRRVDLLYRLFQPVIQMLARLNRALLGDGLPQLQREIQAAGLPRCWLAEEYLARAELIAVLTTPVYVYVLLNWLGAVGLVLVLAAVPLTAWLLRRRVSARAAARLTQIKRRMPFLLDLLTLLMEAGSTFVAAVRQSCEEFRGHPVAEEFGRVLADMNMGKTRTEAFQVMRDRLADDEITSIIGSIIQGESLGTPLAGIFRIQADVLRLKRSQRAEMIAGEAGVKMLLPGVLVMMAAVLIIVGPFLLQYAQFLSSGLFSGQ